MNKKYVVTGIILIIISIVLGAFGAHSLKKALIDFPEKLTSFETGVKYQMYMGLSFLWFGTSKLPNIKFLYQIWLLGIILFSFSIYLLSVSSIIGYSFRFLGPITPIGGLLMIIGWITLLFSVFKTKK